MSIEHEANQRYLMGVKKHGELDLSTDPRNFITEALEELVDAYNYVNWAIMPKLAKKSTQLILKLLYNILKDYE